MKTLLASLAGLAVLAAPAPALALAQTYAVTNGRVVTNTAAGVIENGSVLIRDGDIVAVGPNVEIPAEATVIDADGGWITPGLFAPATALGLIEVGAEDDARDASAPNSPFSVSLDVADGFNPNSTHIPSTRMEGVTRFALMPGGGADIFAGTGALGHTGGGLFDTSSFVRVSMNQSGADEAGGSRPAAWAYLEAALSDARAYPGRYAGTSEGLVLNRQDAAALVPVARGRMPLVIDLDRAVDISRALAFAEENNLDLIINGGAEAWLVADELAAAGVPVILDPLRNLPESFDALAATLDNAQYLHEASARFALTYGDNYFNVRLLAQSAGNAVGAGLDWDTAFRSITLTPAEIYGVGDRYGALAAGYAADVVVWDGDPLEVMSAPTALFIDGAPGALESRQLELARRYRDMQDDAPFAYRR